MVGGKALLTGAIALGAAVALATPAAAEQLTEVWRTGGFEHPQSVAYDPERRVLFVSNAAGDPRAKDGNGYISLLDIDGNVIERKWKTDLNAPNGTLVSGSWLYVTDIDELAHIHIPTRQREFILVVGGGAGFLDDIVVVGDRFKLLLEDETPDVYVSDTVENVVWLLEAGALAIWYREEGKLAGPNGLAVVDEQLVVAQRGDDDGGLPAVRQIDLATKQISDFGPSGSIGVPRGLEAHGDGSVTLTDSAGGRLLRMTPGQPAVEIATIGPGSAGHEWVPELNLFVIPNAQTGEVVAYTLAE